MALALRNPRALTFVVQICIIMLIFCFAGCAAGSCLSYGHSCWGAHGKRSDDRVGATMRILATKTSSNGFPRNNGVAPPSKSQWILSRLIAGQPVLPFEDKYRVRWGDLAKNKDAAPKWQYDAVPVNVDESVEPIRIPINKGDNEKKTSSLQSIMRSANEKLGNIPEIILVSPDGYDKSINGFRKLDMLEFLDERNENAK